MASKLYTQTILPIRTGPVLTGLIESNTTLREGRGNPIRVSKIAIHDEACRVVDVANLGHEDGIPESLPQYGVWLFFSFLPKMSKIMSKTYSWRDFPRLFGVDVLWRHRWITSGMGLSHPPEWDNISPDVKIGGYSCFKSEKNTPPPRQHTLKDFQFSDRKFNSSHFWRIIQIQVSDEKLWPEHRLSLCVHRDLDLEDMTLGQGHNTRWVMDKNNVKYNQNQT